MIYDRDNLQIPILCPIQFSEPAEYTLYKQQLDYIPLLSTIGHKISVLISEYIYNSVENLVLNAYSEDELLLETFTFAKKELSEGYFYATVTIGHISDEDDKLVYFEIKNGNSLLANSLYYRLNPTHTQTLKVLKYSNAVNDWNTIFKEDVSEINIPISEAMKEWFSSCVLSITETNYVLTFTAKENSIIDGDDDFDTEINGNFDYEFEYDANDIIKNFNIYFNDKYLGNIHTEEVTAVENQEEYVVEVPRETLQNYNINMLCMTAEDNIIIFDTEFMVFGNSFTATNEFEISVECGTIPKDVREEQEIEDYIQQDMINETVYGEVYQVLPFTFGTSKGIPYWLASKINRASLCDSFKINDEKLVRVVGSKMEKVDDTENGLGVYRIDFQQEINYLQ